MVQQTGWGQCLSCPALHGQQGAALLEGRYLVGPGRELPNVSAGDEVGLAFSVPTSIASLNSDISPEENKVPRNQETCLKSQKC